MDDLDKLAKHIRSYLWLVILLENLILGGSIYLAIHYLSFPLYVDFSLAGGLAIIFITIVVWPTSNFLIQPIAFIRQSILHLSPTGNLPVKAPDIKNLSIGQQLVTNLTGQLYEIARLGHENALRDRTKGISNVSEDFIANSLPLPLFILDENETVKFANSTAASYLGVDQSELIGKNIYMILDMSFPSEETFDKWLKEVKRKTATASESWERVRLSVRDSHPTLLFDLAAYYNQGNNQGYSTLLVLFDHTKQYSQDDQAVSFVALSVHELRTPLTLLRGYIEVFEQELHSQVSPELADFLDKMHATSEQLTAFVNNILNVARVDNDQLELKLLPEDWSSVLTKTVDDIRLRATVRGISLDLTISPDLPKVGVDRLSIQEVINNLIDNAIKYSGNSKNIKITSNINGEGLVETSVQDFGVGVPTSIMPNLFSKYYRDHRNRAQIGGTGLGLYLSKAIVSAHGGNLWVRSQEGKGSTFSFTVLPYDKLSKELKSKDDDFVRSAHGWIKNHSYYRR